MAVGTALLLEAAKKLALPILRRYITGKDAQREAERELEHAVLNYEEAQLDARKEIILAEAHGSRLQREWRPRLMETMRHFLIAYGFVLPVYNFVLVPLLVWKFPTIPLRAIDAKAVWEGVPDELWLLLQISIGGYIASRGVEKTFGAEGAGREKLGNVLTTVAGGVGTVVGGVAGAVTGAFKPDGRGGLFTNAFDRRRAKAKAERIAEADGYVDTTLERKVIEAPIRP